MLGPAHHRRMIRHALWTALVLSACDVPAPASDAGPADANDLAVAAPAMPAPPGAPRATCPVGWTALHDPETCEPWPDGHRPVCAAGRRLAAGGCVDIASDCSAVPPEVASGASYVLSGSTYGDGSLAHPFGTIAEALASGATDLALGAGSYDLPTSVTHATISGACPTSTTLVVVDRTVVGDVTLRRLRLGGAGGLVGDAVHTLTLDRIEITMLAGGIVTGGSLHVTGLEMHDVVAGLVARGAHDLTFEDVAIEHVAGTALDVEGATSVQLTRVFVADMTSAVPDTNAIQIARASTLTIDTLAIEHAGGNGMAVSGHALDARHVMVRQVAAIALGFLSDTTSPPAPMTLAEAWIATTGMGGILFGGGSYVASDLVITNVQGDGIAPYMSTTSIDRAWIDGALAQGIGVTGGELTLTDATVQHVAHDPATPGSGGALLAEQGAIVHVTGARFDATESYGLAVTGASQIDLTQTEIGNVSPMSTNDGFGAVANGASTLTLQTVLVHDVHSVGILLQGGRLTATDLTIQRVTSIDDVNGIGLCAQVDGPSDPPSMVTLLRTDVSDVTRWGVLISGERATLDATDLTIGTVHRAVCCEQAQGGAALVLDDGAVAEVNGFLTHFAEEAGLIATGGVRATLRRGRIVDNEVGMILSPRLQFNTGGFPGVVTQNVIVSSNQTPTLNTDTEVTAPSIVLLP